MPPFDILKETNPGNSFRVNAVRMMFDLREGIIQERFQGNINIEKNNWNIGVIYGASGTGKSSIAQELFSKNYIREFKYNSPTVIDDMPGENIKAIVKMFNAVGFSSPPSWLKPYSVLSTGEKMRVDLARAILSEMDLIVFDEFTSVVNREVARIGSYAIQKTVRKLNKKFIAVSCHEDILDWLEPDWTYCTNDGCFFLSGREKDQKLNLKYSVVAGKYGKCLDVITI